MDIVDFSDKDNIIDTLGAITYAIYNTALMIHGSCKHGDVKCSRDIYNELQKSINRSPGASESNKESLIEAMSYLDDIIKKAS